MSGLLINPYLVVPGTPAYSHATNGYSWCSNYTGTAASLAITGCGFAPDMVLVDRVDSTDDAKFYFNGLLGAGNYFEYDGTLSPVVDAQSITSFDSDGFTLGTSTASNASGGVYRFIAIKFISGFASGFTYTGNGSAGNTAAHGLGATPTVFAVRAIAKAYTWRAYTAGGGNTVANGPASSTALGGFHANAEPVASVQLWNNTSPDGTNITLGTFAGVNENLTVYDGFALADVAGKLKTGNYTGNGNASGPVVTGLGFLPAGVWIVAVAGTATDSPFAISSITSAYAGNNFDPLGGAKTVATDITMDSDGFTITASTASFNTNGTTYRYIAFAA